MTDTLIANPARLPDGSWGARVLGAIQPDSLVTIKTREGKTWEAIVTEIVEAPNPKSAYSLVRTKSSFKGQTPSRATQPAVSQSGQVNTMAGFAGTREGHINVQARVIPCELREVVKGAATYLGEVLKITSPWGQTAYVTVIGADLSGWYSQKELWGLHFTQGVTEIGGRILHLYYRSATNEEATPKRDRDQWLDANTTPLPTQQKTEKQAWEDAIAKAKEGLVESVYLTAHSGGGTLLAEYGTGIDRSTCTRFSNGVIFLSTPQRHWCYGTPEQVREAVEQFAKDHSITEEKAHKHLARYAGYSGWEGYRQILGIPDFLGAEECRQISQSWCDNMGINPTW